MGEQNEGEQRLGHRLDPNALGPLSAGMDGMNGSVGGPSMSGMNHVSGNMNGPMSGPMNVGGMNGTGVGQNSGASTSGGQNVFGHNSSGDVDD